MDDVDWNDNEGCNYSSLKLTMGIKEHFQLYENEIKKLDDCWQPVAHIHQEEIYSVTLDWQGGLRAWLDFGNVYIREQLITINGAFIVKT